MTYQIRTTWTLLDSVDVLPDIGLWATINLTWTPDVIDQGDGTFVMYAHTLGADYAAKSPSQMTHCIGAATSTNPMGPYTPQMQPIACQTVGSGAIDPAGFQDGYPKLPHVKVYHTQYEVCYKKVFLKDPCPPLDSQDDFLPQDAIGHFIYTQLPSPLPVHQQSPIMNPDTGADTTGKTMAGLKRQWEEETNPQLQTPQWFGNGHTNTRHVKSASPLQPANKCPQLGQALDIEIKSHTEKLKEATRNLQGEAKDPSNKQTNLLQAILDILKDRNWRSRLDECTISITHKKD
ncbi:hypothetical protein EDC04DRAFT_2609425 [Pisolithus marmoratus]|nr:hypothetical protein EDC04DRAFT_2609425 [Pisolithus marmoratus]